MLLWRCKEARVDGRPIDKRLLLVQPKPLRQTRDFRGDAMHPGDSPKDVLKLVRNCRISGGHDSHIRASTTDDDGAVDKVENRAELDRLRDPFKMDHVGTLSGEGKKLP